MRLRSRLRIKLPKQSKNRNKPVFVTPTGEFVGQSHPGPKRKVFDSQGEYGRYLELVAERNAGLIESLQTQVTFKLHARGSDVVICRYKADFVYMRNGVRVVEDFKGMRTAMYKLKRAWLAAEYGITILETTRKCR